MSNSLGGGDQLARGAKSAQFSGAATISQFEDDLIFRPEIIAEKYGLTEEQISSYRQDRENGVKLPEIPTVEELKELEISKAESLIVGFSVTDRRHNFEAQHPLSQESKAVVAVKKYPDQEYGDPSPILDRILVKRVSDDPNMEVLADGTMRDKRTGFLVPPQYRQHSNVGVVLAIGDFVVMGGVKTQLSNFIQPGDKVKFGDYNSEVFVLSDAETEKLCDQIKMNFVSDPEGLRIIRVQDVRVIMHPKEESNG